jgi:hypothetical protein
MYGQLPKQLGNHQVDCKEMMFYQYLPIKLTGEHMPVFEDRLKCYDKLIGAICCDYIGTYGLDRFVGSYVYLTAKHLYQAPGCSFNRPGWHSDGFMTEDINYIWYDKDPTVFNKSDFVLTMDDSFSLSEMKQQAKPRNDVTYPVNALLRLNQYNIHMVGETTSGLRNFLKVSFSKDKYDLIGNSHNYLLNYEWEMKPRNEQRNIPQSLKP